MVGTSVGGSTGGGTSVGGSTGGIMIGIAVGKKKIVGMTVADAEGDGDGVRLGVTVGAGVGVWLPKACAVWVCLATEVASRFTVGDGWLVAGTLVAGVVGLIVAVDVALIGAVSSPANNKKALAI